MSRFAAAIARAFRRYAAWLVAISWKRFILLSVLLLIIAGVASEIPPFTWRIMETAPKVSTLHEPSGESADAAGSLAADIKREVIDEIRAGRKASRRVRLGDYLPNLAFLFIIVSAAIKIAYAGRVKAEAKAAEAQEMAEAESLKRQVVEARMAAMQAQVEPHFLFNTLASIDHLIEVDPPRASRMQKNLIALLRASMPAMRESAATLGRELQVVRPYLEILKVRMEDRLRAEINVAEGLYSADFPPMVLQSL
ncbi:MAG: histidine kinase, partial [Betaproteobacteria bacterium]